MHPIVRVLLLLEDRIVAQILRSPGFRRSVHRIHDRVQHYRHGPNPHEPLRQGEATSMHPREPGVESNGFLSQFARELQNQLRGNPSKSKNIDPKNPPKP
ncbi:hypothetical protein F5Y15DRAFT_110037 [Xylariaceae sp. FL0016]|nr:hypothetical protein F5Y15DRAFT_110037 [Xylariaceae sp. FL0016]